MKYNQKCQNCHGKGFYMDDDLCGTYTQFECDCGEECGCKCGEGCEYNCEDKCDCECCEVLQ